MPIRKTFVVTFIPAILLLSVCLPVRLEAHPAREISVTYDKATSLLKIVIVHESEDFDRHYIEKVWVSVNQKERIRQSFSSQDDLQGLQLQYKMFHLKKGDIITVECRCNIFGRQATSVEIE
ncbi:MAG: hypothetical protein ACP5FZ_06950 [Fidelibacterota bacterium]